MTNTPLSLPICDVYKSSFMLAKPRKRAWRNLMVLAINAGLEQNLFTLMPDANQWGINDKAPGALFTFELPSGHKAKGWCGAAESGELAIHAAINPIENRLRCITAGSYAGDAFGQCWLNRSSSAYLLTPYFFYCKKDLLESLAALSADSIGYTDKR